MNFDTIFNPQSIALIGASRDSESVGYSLLTNLLHPSYKGTVYPVNPKTDTILNTHCYASITEIQKPIDLAIIAIPAAYVLDTVSQAIQSGIRSFIIISAGFKEQGQEGAEKEHALLQLCEQNNAVIVGPNCLGILNPHIGLNASFETILPKEGSIALVSQSGALISSLLDISNTRGIGFSKIISVGNKAQIDEHALLPYLFADQQTRVIALYTEHLTRAPELINLLRDNQQSNNPKAVIMLKAGVTQEGMQASASHTGSLAGSDMAYDALRKQAGIIRVQTMDELLTTAHVFSTNPLPSGNKLAILTNAGGPGILATDAASRANVLLSHFSQKTKDTLQTFLPANAHPANPIDLLGDARSERYKQALETVIQDDDVDSVLVIVTPQTMTDIPETAAGIINVRNAHQKPVVASFIGSRQIDPGKFLLAATQLAHNPFPDTLITAIHHFYTWSEILKKAKDRESPTFTQVSLDTIQLPNASTRSLIDTNTVFEILKRTGLNVVTSILAQSEGEAEEKGKLFHSSIACKIVSPDISHKTDVGGVLLHVSPDKTKEAFHTIIENIRTHAPQARTDGVLMTEMITGEGAEFFLGIKYEPELGYLILAGLGGIYVEILKDISARFAPVSREDALQMIDELKAKALLTGLRGKKPLDQEAFIDMICKISNLALSMPQIKELDINPVFVREKGLGAVIIDARIVIQ